MLLGDGRLTVPYRIEMCELAARETSTWLSCDPWEAIQPDYVPTAEVLDQYVLPTWQDIHGIMGAWEVQTSVGYRVISEAPSPGSIKSQPLYTPNTFANLLFSVSITR